MTQEVTNFGRFYATFNKIPYSGDREDLKKEMVEKVTLGRTGSLREVTKREYQDLCEGLEKIYPANRIKELAREELRRQRSICLRLMQKLGIDTTDWNRINAFCQDGRIAGKQFRDITSEELEQLTKKLRSIERKGGLRSLDEGPKAKIVNIN
ncbi:hypothetical protein SAMN05216354_0626 [Xylanibacter ruminicola]|uniref:Uncharacterized protein n=1 Tax=Xylanibacter ruminicola TaxID=839 RepID=A0A1H5SCX9_XYLRU|nr:hypothetical protein [Xylanibacter ruminicola]SEF48449.1 hypothetical protein SAMN05216354_0626 [Xylanibacter ruminicola]